MRRKKQFTNTKTDETVENCSTVHSEYKHKFCSFLTVELNFKIRVSYDYNLARKC